MGKRQGKIKGKTIPLDLGREKPDLRGGGVPPAPRRAMPRKPPLKDPRHWTVNVGLHQYTEKSFIQLMRSR